MTNTDTTGYDLEPFPTSWGITPARMDSAVDLAAQAVRDGLTMDQAVDMAMTLIGGRA